MGTSKFLKAVLLTGLIAGTLDATAASLQYFIKTGNNPARVFRYIASAIFREDAGKGELYSWAAAGLFFHYVIAFIWTITFFFFYKPIKKLFKNKYVAGIVYALIVWCIMNFLVVPIAFGTDIVQHAKDLFSQARLKSSLIAMGILIIAIGLPVSLLADRYYSKIKIN